MVWQKRIMKGMKGEWVMDLNPSVRFGLPEAIAGNGGIGVGIIGNGPIDIRFEEDRLSSRLGYHRNAPVVFLESIPRSIDAFLAECRGRWLLWRDAPVDERKHRQADDPVGSPRYLVEV